MLKQRVMTAIALLMVLLPTLLWAPLWLFAALTGAMVAAGVWEFTRLNRHHAPAHATPQPTTAMQAALWQQPRVQAGLCVLLGVAIYVLGLHNPKTSHAFVQGFKGWTWLLALLWTVGAGWLLRSHGQVWAQLSWAQRQGLGVAVLLSAWVALVLARRQGDNYLLSVLVLVWVADVAAYAGGKLWGRRKLAPTISPGKSWEGVASACVAVWVLGWLWVALERGLHASGLSWFGKVWAHQGWLGLLLGSTLMVGGGVVGDLTESVWKRFAGVKDSSQLLPGHGGVLDRVDALLPVLPLAAWWISF